MLGDAHSTNWAENKEFFLNQNNPANFERTWGTAYFLYRRIGMVSNPVPFDQVMDFSVVKKLGGEPRYANQRNEYQVQFVPTTASSVQAENSEILTKTVVIRFYPNSSDLHKKIVTQVQGQDREELYDANVDFVVDEIGRLAGQYGAARIIIEGHTDASMKGRIDPAAVKELSTQRANAVKEAVLRRFRGLEPNQFLASGMGWDRAYDPSDPMNNSKNRRVEVKVYPLESTN
jgi:outer membrane protein OmpA-like peptidoglycan-associated protein